VQNDVGIHIGRVIRARDEIYCTHLSPHAGASTHADSRSLPIRQKPYHGDADGGSRGIYIPPLYKR
jgi:hypothetical protein